MNTDDKAEQSRAEQRFVARPALHWILAAGVAVGVLGAILVTTGARWLYVAIAVISTAIWLYARAARFVLVISEQGFRVERRGRQILRAGFDEVKRVRAVPEEIAMYVELGTPERNLLLPPRGMGFSFERQKELYDVLASRLADRVEIVEALVNNPVDKTKEPK